MGKNRKKRINGTGQGALTMQSWARGLLKGIVWTFVGGIILAAFNDVVNICGIALRNASTGIWQKFIDTYYITAASAGITDCGTLFSILASTLIIFTIYAIACGFSWGYTSALKVDLEDTAGDQRKGDCSEHVSNKYRRFRRRSLIMTVCAVVSVITFFYIVSLEYFSYELLRDYNQSLRCIRYVLTDKQLQELDGYWVRIRSKQDYKRLCGVLDEYKKMADKTFEDSLSLESSLFQKATLESSGVDGLKNSIGHE